MRLLINNKPKIANARDLFLDETNAAFFYYNMMEGVVSHLKLSKTAH